MAVKLIEKYLAGLVSPDEIQKMAGEVQAAHQMLHEGTGAGSEFRGWLDLPVSYDREEYTRLKEAASWIRQNAQVLLVIGIGGSYLGARAAVEFLKSPFYNNFKKETPDIYFVGNSLSPTYLREVIGLCSGREAAINVVSKSGTTTEPAVAFRQLKEYMEARYGQEAAKRIFCTTDRKKGALKSLADKMGYETFVVPDDVGGRYSVLTPVGLLPMAVAGIDTDRVLEGAAQARSQLMNSSLEENPCYRYAAIRNLLYRRGKAIELLVSYEPAFAMMAQWYIQLFGESEGKEGKGLYPSCANFSTDLHSMGQFIQQGTPLLFETVVDILEPKMDFFIRTNDSNFDGLNFLAEQNLSAINRKAMEGTILAHTAGGVPNLVLQMQKIDEENFGYFVYFMEKACAISGYLLGVNPFDQPGVEQYKQNMFALLGKPGYEALRDQLESQLNKL